MNTSPPAVLAFAPSTRLNLTYAGLVVFTLMVYLRPYEYLPIGSFPLVRVIGMVMLVAFFLEQPQHRAISVKPPEFRYLLWLSLCMVLSIPLAIDPGEAFGAFFDIFLKAALTFMVMINAVNSLARLRRLLAITSICTTIIALGTLSNFIAGEGLVSGRAQGWVGGMFGNPNDLALALNMAIPSAVGLALISRETLSKLFHLGCAALMGAAVLVTYSRAGFLTAVVLGGFLLLRLGRRSSSAALLVVLAAVGLLMLAPGGYWGRILTIFSDAGGDVGAVESTNARWDLLVHSISFGLVNPKVWVLGLGMSNYHIVAPRENATHNSYLEVFTEVGVPALVLYLLFLSAVLKRSGRIARLYEGSREGRPIWALALGIQGSLFVYAFGSLFASVAYLFYLYYAAGFAVCLGLVVETPSSPPARARPVARR